MTWPDVVTQLASFGIGVAALGWLARAIIVHWLGKDVEQYRSKLQSAHDVEMEKLRNDLRLRSIEHEIRFRSIHARQADALAGIDTLEGYTDWMKGLLTPVPDGRCEVRSFAIDENRKNVAAYGVFRGTHTGEGGPLPPTGKQIEADYVYVMQFDGNKIHHMTKIWNDGISLKQLGWV